jgi:glycosyltransferase involved in cell wall biosynthesis
VVKVSVCMITYNHEKFIEHAVNSVLQQDVDFDYEVVVGEDCSTDSTASTLERLESQNRGRLRVIYRRPNIGGQQNLKRTLTACQGEYIAFLEGDDYWTSKSKLQLQVDFLECNLNASGVYHRTTVTNAAALPSERRQPPVIPPVDPPRFFSLDYLTSGNPLHVSSLVARRASLRNIDVWLADVRPGDWALSMMLATKGDLGFIPLEMSHYRVHEAGHYTRLSQPNRTAIALRMLRHVSRLVSGADKDLVERVIAAFANHWRSVVVRDSEILLDEVMNDLDAIGDVRFSNYLLGQVVDFARVAKEADHERLSVLEGELGMRRNELKATLERSSVLEGELASRKNELKANLKRLSVLEGELASRKNELKANLERLSVLEGELATQRAKLDDAEQVVDTLENEVKERDRTINGIRRSISWKIVSPLWRLETRRHRKARRTGGPAMPRK